MRILRNILIGIFSLVAALFVAFLFASRADIPKYPADFLEDDAAIATFLQAKVPAGSDWKAVQAFLSGQGFNFVELGKEKLAETKRVRTGFFGLRQRSWEVEFHFGADGKLSGYEAKVWHGGFI